MLSPAGFNDALDEHGLVQSQMLEFRSLHNYIVQVIPPTIFVKVTLITADVRSN